jgi:hypothetical protein
MNPRSRFQSTEPGIDPNYKIPSPSPMNPRSRFQSTEPGIDPNYKIPSPSPMNSRSRFQSTEVTEPGIDPNYNVVSPANPRSIISGFANYDEGESSDDGTFSSFNQHDNMTSYKQSFEKDIFKGNTHYINPYLTTQSNLANKVYTTASSTTNGLFFQDETHLIQWLETRKDLVLQVLNIILLPGQVS